MGRSALHPGLQCTASRVSVHCVRTCSALRPKQSQTHVLARTDCSVLNKLTLLTYQYETKQEEG